MQKPVDPSKVMELPHPLGCPPQKNSLRLHCKPKRGKPRGSWPACHTAGDRGLRPLWGQSRWSMEFVQLHVHVVLGSRVPSPAGQPLPKTPCGELSVVLITCPRKRLGLGFAGLREASLVCCEVCFGVAPIPALPPLPNLETGFLSDLCYLDTRAEGGGCHPSAPYDFLSPPAGIRGSFGV